MDFRAVRYTLFLLTCTGVSFGQELLLPERMNMKVGEDLVITPISIINASRLATKWYCNRTLILTEAPAGVIIQPPYTGRVSLNTTTLALTLRSLNENDTAQYSLEMVTVTYTNTSVTSVQVLVAVENVVLLPNETELVEFNSTVNIRCSASGSFLTFKWLNRSSEITAGDRVQLTDNNSSLIITNVTRHDTGPYQCDVSNVVSKKTSPDQNLIIHYGPENVAVKACPGGPIYSAGSKVIVNCSAESSHAAEYQWAVNGSELSQKGQTLTMNNIQISQSGNYTCISHNTKTLRYSTSPPISITVLVQGWAIIFSKGPHEKPEVCSWAEPTITLNIVPDDNRFDLSPFLYNTNWSWQFRCIDMAASNVTIVTDNTEVELNSTVTLVCSATGSSLSFIWRNGSSDITAGERVQLTNNNTTLTITRVIGGDTGPYQCEASNIVSKDLSPPFHLKIKKKKHFLSVGAKVGIAFAVLLGTAGAAGLAYWFVKKHKRETSSTGNKHAGENGGQHELHYADIRHNQRHQGTKANDPTVSHVSQQRNIQPASNHATETLYSDVRNVK